MPHKKKKRWIFAFLFVAGLNNIILFKVVGVVAVLSREQAESKHSYTQVVGPLSLSGSGKWLGE